MGKIALIADLDHILLAEYELNIFLNSMERDSKKFHRMLQNYNDKWKYKGEQLTKQNIFSALLTREFHTGQLQNFTMSDIPEIGDCMNSFIQPEALNFYEEFSEYNPDISMHILWSRFSPVVKQSSLGQLFDVHGNDFHYEPKTGDVFYYPKQLTNEFDQVSTIKNIRNRCKGEDEYPLENMIYICRSEYYVSRWLENSGGTVIIANNFENNVYPYIDYNDGSELTNQILSAIDKNKETIKK